MSAQIILTVVVAVATAIYLYVNRNRLTKPLAPWSRKRRETGSPKEQSAKTNAGLTADAGVDSIKHTTKANQWRHLANSLAPALTLAADGVRKSLGIYNTLYAKVAEIAPHAWPGGLSKFLKWAFYLVLLGSSFFLLNTAARVYELRQSAVKGLLGALDSVGITPPICVAFAAAIGFVILGTYAARHFQAAALSKDSPEVALAPPLYARGVHIALALAIVAVACSLAWFWADLASMALGSMSKSASKPSTGSGFVGGASPSSSSTKANPEWTFRVLMMAEFCLSWIIAASTSSPLTRVIESNRRGLKLGLLRMRFLHWGYAAVNRRAELHAHLASHEIEVRLPARKAAASITLEEVEALLSEATTAMGAHARASVPTTEVTPIDVSGVFDPKVVSTPDEEVA